ncbi:hypothetical protein [Streptomyces sp. NPDC047939]|uniref:hypothetical protein n=1 Tax=Streptomyces sp. NPDC047939 TaxID=3155381 RepID=UPI0034274B6E
MLYPFELPPAVGLSDTQWSGSDCVYCAGPHPLKAVGRMRGVLVFAHHECAERHRLPDTDCCIEGCGRPAIVMEPVLLCAADAIRVREGYVAAQVALLDAELAALGDSEEDPPK